MPNPFALAITPEYVVEYDEAGTHRMLTIVRREDGFQKVLLGKGIKSNFIDCVTKFGIERTMQTFLRMVKSIPWEPGPYRVPV